MRIAILSDIHGNRTAFEAVPPDLQQTSPDLILHGGDLADAGASPVELVDRIRDLGGQGGLGNTDEMLFRPESLEEFCKPIIGAALPLDGDPSDQMAAVTRTMLGEERIAWLRGLAHVCCLRAHSSPLHSDGSKPTGSKKARRQHRRRWPVL